MNSIRLTGGDRMTLPAQVLEDCLRAFGTPLVLWALGLHASPTSPDELASRQVEGLTALHLHAQRVNGQASSTARNFARAQLVTPVSTTPDRLSEGPITSMRRYVGGAVLLPSSSDALTSSLMRLCRDYYPVELIEWEIDAFPETMRFHSSNFAAAYDFCVAALADEAISSLFSTSEPGDPSETLDIHSIGSVVKWLSGRGGSLQLSGLPDAILLYSATLLRIKGLLSLDTLYEEAQKSIALVKTLALGREAEVAGIATLGNVSVPDNLPVEISGAGTVYPWASTRSPVFQGSASIPVTAVLVSTFRQRLENVLRDPEDPHAMLAKVNMPEIQRRHDEFNDKLERTRLAFVLASDTDSILAPVLCAWGPLDPTTPAQSHSFNAAFSTPMPPVALTQELVARVEYWSTKITRPNRSLDIGVRRLISAATARVDQLDGLIDAVMCWENIFGDTPETNFKVCGSLAMLLEPIDAVRRAARFKRLKDLYAARSKLVHGVSEPPVDKREALRVEALGIALQALRLVLTNEELAECSNSAERSKMILLGFRA